MEIECASCGHRLPRSATDNAPCRCPRCGGTAWWDGPTDRWHRTHGDDLDALGAAFVCVTIIAMMADEHPGRQAIIADALAGLLHMLH